MRRSTVAALVVAALLGGTLLVAALVVAGWGASIVLAVRLALSVAAALIATLARGVSLAALRLLTARILIGTPITVVLSAVLFAGAALLGTWIVSHGCSWLWIRGRRGSRHGAVRTVPLAIGIDHTARTKLAGVQVR
ncbi:Uncharacterised protein [Mycobacteroides abscessus]|nr:Uncharacterised protein [Mycobacteroides abscessus]CQA08639.1 Uncharacterised protein [Mycobacteroides abscessus]CQA10845.1 Uncharacterised protein [Mycobacteroides abscessus]